MLTYQKIQQEIGDLIKKTLQEEFFLRLEQIRLTKPPEQDMGDLSFGCFGVGARLQKNPKDIALRLAKILSQNVIASEAKQSQTSHKRLLRRSTPRNDTQPIIVKQVQAAGPYVNFFIDDNVLFSAVVKNIIKQGKKAGESDIGQNQRVIIEYSSPNTNKPQHIGHLRNNFLGDSLARILQTLGWQVKKVSIINDRGVHICKSMLMYQKYGSNQSPENLGKKPDHFVGNFYEMYAQQKNQNKLKEEVQEMLKKWEDGNKKIIALWKKMNNWVYKGWDRTYKILNISFDKIYYESNIYKLGKEIVKEGLEKQIFYRRDDGAVEVDLTEYGLDKKVLIRADGTSIYMTMDLALAKLKFHDFPKTVKSIYIVGSAQEYHFKALFKILELLGYKNIDAYYHLSYGMVRLKSGKMSSREGNVINADDLIDKVVGLASKEIKKRGTRYGESINYKKSYEMTPDSQTIKVNNIIRTAKAIGLGALKYYLLHVDPKKNIVFDVEKAISFEGFTGPYIMYTFARMQSILAKTQISNFKFQNYISNLKAINLNLEEREIVNKLSQFSIVLQKAAEEYNPALLAHYLYELSTSINSFYHKHQVLKAPATVKLQRLMMLEACGIVIKKGLELLGIEAVERM